MIAPYDVRLRSTAFALNYAGLSGEAEYESNSAETDGQLKSPAPEIIDQVEYEIKYEGFIARQLKEVERFRHVENIKIPADIDYSHIQGLSIEIRQKLKQFCPVNLGQAHPDLRCHPGRHIHFDGLSAQKEPGTPKSRGAAPGSRI